MNQEEVGAVHEKDENYLGIIRGKGTPSFSVAINGNLNPKYTIKYN